MNPEKDSLADLVSLWSTKVPNLMNKNLLAIADRGPHILVFWEEPQTGS